MTTLTKPALATLTETISLNITRRTKRAFFYSYFFRIYNYLYKITIQPLPATILAHKPNFEKIEEINIKFRNQIALLDYHVKHIDEKIELINAQEKIKKIEQKNLEYLGLFSTLMTFLVGLLSIFIGNNGNVSIFEKMEYVIALGGILTILLIVGYILITDKIHYYIKTMILIMILLVSSMIYCRERKYQDNKLQHNNSIITNNWGCPQ